MEPMFKPDDASCYERGCANCYQCGHQWQNIFLNGATIICLTCGTANQIVIRYTTAGNLKVSRALAREERLASKRQKARRDAKQRRKEKRVSLVLIVIGLLISIPTFFVDFGAFGLPVFWIGANAVVIGAMSFAYLRSLQF